MTDPIERIVMEALEQRGVAFVGENDSRARYLDFYLPEYDTHIEVKQFHTPRTASQMERSDNIIVIVGRKAAESFREMLNK